MCLQSLNGYILFVYSARRSSAARSAVAGQRTAGRRPVRTQFGRRDREQAALASCSAH